MAGPQRRPPGPRLPHGSISVFTLNVDRKRAAGRPPPSANTHGQTSPTARKAVAGLSQSPPRPGLPRAAINFHLKRCSAGSSGPLYVLVIGPAARRISGSAARRLSVSAAQRFSGSGATAALQ